MFAQSSPLTNQMDVHERLWLIYLFLTDDEEASDNSAAMEASVTKEGSETPRKKTKKQKKHKSKKKRKKRKCEKDSSSESEESDCGMQTRAR